MNAKKKETTNEETNELTTEVSSELVEWTAKVEEKGLTVAGLENQALFQADAELLEAMEMCDEDVTLGDLTRVKIPSDGKTSWNIETISGDENHKELEGILVCVAKGGVLWPNDDPKPGTRPVLRTDDLKTAVLGCEPEDVPADMAAVISDYVLNADEVAQGLKPVYNWEALPYNKFGTGKKGIGKRCVEQRNVFLLRDCDVAPILVRIQPGSLKVFTSFLKAIPTTAGVPYYRCRVSLGLVKETSAGGVEYSQVAPRLVGVLNPADGAEVKKMFTAPLIEGLAARLAAKEDADGYNPG